MRRFAVILLVVMMCVVGMSGCLGDTNQDASKELPTAQDKMDDESSDEITDYPSSSNYMQMEGKLKSYIKDSFLIYDINQTLRSGSSNITVEWIKFENDYTTIKIKVKNDDIENGVELSVDDILLKTNNGDFAKVTDVKNKNIASFDSANSEKSYTLIYNKQYSELQEVNSVVLEVSDVSLYVKLNNPLDEESYKDEALSDNITLITNPETNIYESSKYFYSEISQKINNDELYIILDALNITNNKDDVLNISIDTTIINYMGETVELDLSGSYITLSEKQTSYLDEEQYNEPLLKLKNFDESISTLQYVFTDTDISELSYLELHIPLCKNEKGIKMGKEVIVGMNIDIPTESITPIPTPSPTPTPTPSPIPTPSPTPSPSPTPTSSPTPSPIPTPSPTPIPLPELSLPNNFFGSGGISEYDTNYKIANDYDGNIYYVDKGAIKKLETKTGKTTIFITKDDIKGESISGIQFEEGKLYIEVNTSSFDKPFGIYDVQAGKRLREDITFNRFYFNGLVMNMIEDRPNKYEFINLETGELEDISNLSAEFEGKYVYGRYHSDDYIIFESYEYINEGEEERTIKTLYFVDAKSYEILGVLYMDDITKDRFTILHCENNDMYILTYDTNYKRLVFKKYNIQTDKLTTLVEFNKGRSIIKFNPKNRCIYFTFGAFYEHQLDGNQYTHEGSEECLTELGKETGVERFMKINIDTKEITHLQDVSTWEYIKGEYCINVMHPYIIWNYVIVIAQDLYESEDPYWYHGKFYLGSEIDYNTWRE